MEELREEAAGQTKNKGPRSSHAIILSESTVNVYEHRTNLLGVLTTYTVRLSTAPTADVTITLSSGQRPRQRY